MIGIYMIKNLINNKVYIGQSINVDNRIYHHIKALRHNYSDSKLLQDDWNKYGESAFCFIVLEQCSQEQLDELERKYIANFNSTNSEKGYNILNGGVAGFEFPEHLRQKQSEFMKGRFVKEKNPMWGKHFNHTEEWLKWASERFSGENNPMYGVHLKRSEENKQKQKERMSGENNPFYGKRHTKETRRKISNSRQKTPVLCVETGEKYESAKEAMNKTGIHNGSILRAAKNNLTAGGYHWKIIQQ